MGLWTVPAQLVACHAHCRGCALSVLVTLFCRLQTHASAVLIILFCRLQTHASALEARMLTLAAGLGWLGGVLAPLYWVQQSAVLPSL